MRNYTDLSRDELLKIIEKQDKKIESLINPPPNDWHSWFYSQLMIKLFNQPAKVEREVVLGAQPPRADFVIITEDDVVDLGLSIFKGYKKHNIIKNETDERIRSWYRDYLELFSRLDRDTLEEAKRRNPDMAKTWREVFEFDKELKEREKETKLLDIKNVMESLGVSLEKAMDILKISSSQRSLYADLVSERTVFR